MAKHMIQAMLSAETENTAILLEYLVLRYVDKLQGDAHFPFQLDLAPAHRAKTTSSCCTDHGITALN